MSFPTAPDGGERGMPGRAETQLPDAEAQRIVIPLIAEEMTVGKRVVETDRVRIHKTVTEREEIADIPLMREEITVQTVAVNREVEGDVPSIRQEGDTLIIPVLRERFVVKKIIFLAEEIHIRRERREAHEPQTVILRSETAHIERLDVPSTETPEAESTASSTQKGIQR